MKTTDAPIIMAIKGEQSGQRWMVDKPLMIGRDPDCDIVINNRQVSRFHARVMPGKPGVEIEDLGSKNGTLLNGEPLFGKMVLQDGDTLIMAEAIEFQFINSDATMPLGEAHTKLQRLMVDFGSRQVWVNNKQVNPALSAQQFLLLHHLYQNVGNVASRAELIEVVWGADQAAGVTEQALDAVVRRLRERLREMDPDFNYIVTVRGHGVKLENTGIPPIF